MPRTVATRVLQRLGDALLVLAAVSASLFVVLHLAPGDPLTAAQGDPRLTPAVRAAWSASFDANASWPVQFVRMWRSALTGDLGWSWSQQRPVINVIGEALPYTLWLMGLALVASAVTGGALGVWLAVRDRSFATGVVRVLLAALAAVPDAFVALLLISALAVTVPLFPLQGICDVRNCGDLHGFSAFIDLLRHSVLPVLALTLVALTPYARVQRAETLPALENPSIRAARARGIPNAALLRRYVLRRTLVPWIAMIGLALPTLVGGAVFVERVFGWPGLGSALLGAISSRDYPLVMAIAMLGGVLTLAGGLFTDIAIDVFDPRTRDTLAS